MIFNICYFMFNIDHTIKFIPIFFVNIILYVIKKFVVVNIYNVIFFRINSIVSIICIILNKLYDAQNIYFYNGSDSKSETSNIHNNKKYNTTSKSIKMDKI